MKKNIELLAPAGSYESLIAAVKAGADAVYIGGSAFGARAYANNLDEAELLAAIDYVHLHGRKMYLAVNTLLKEEELTTQLYPYLLPYYRQGIDGVIVQDTGVLAFISKYFPGLPIHASTQMTVTNVLGAKFLEERGVERVVPARELNLKEVQEIAEHTGLSVECFVHGALCYCYSGQCLYSSMVGGRSGNRGQCAQPCRLPYQTETEIKPSYLLSLKDICTLELIPEMAAAGISSFKIEGRMKKPEYVALVTAIYRKYLDLYEKNREHGHLDVPYKVEEKDRQMLMDLYNRGGSCEGYYHTHNSKDMISRTRPNHAGVPAIRVEGIKGRSIYGKALTALHAGDVMELPGTKDSYTTGQDVNKDSVITLLTRQPKVVSKGQILNRIRNESLLQEIKSSILGPVLQEKMWGTLTLSKGREAILEIASGHTQVCVTGDIVLQAQNQPMEHSRIEKQMRKTGHALFSFEKLEIKMEDDLFLPLKSLNELRRQGIEALEQAICGQYRREAAVCYKGEDAPYAAPAKTIDRCVSTFFVVVERQEQYEAVIQSPDVSRIYLDCNMLPHGWNNPMHGSLVQRGRQGGKEMYFAMPHIFRKEARDLYHHNYDQFLKPGYDGILVRNLESYAFLKEHGYEKPIVLDHNLYQFNHYSRLFWEQEDHAITYTAALEQNEKELRETGVSDSELIVYGYVPMMISAQCIKRTTKGCSHQSGSLNLKDRYQKEFVVKNYCDYCYNIIYNTTPLLLADQTKEIARLSPLGLRLQFTLEDKTETEFVLKRCSDTLLHGKIWEETKMDFTRGHFKRGIK